jgi:hypothetical protein
LARTKKPYILGKEFAFTKIMTCGMCGSGITADEKLKHQKNGNTHRYVYYKCTRIKDHFCPNALINEDDLIPQLQSLVDDLDIQILPLKEKITEELKRVKKFEYMLLGNKNSAVVKDIDIRNYAKFILQEGSMDEKREFIRCLKSEIVLTDRKVSLR